MGILHVGRFAIRASIVTVVGVSTMSTLATTPRVVVEFRGKPIRFVSGLRPYVSQRTVLVPFRGTASSIGAQVVRDPDGKHVTLTFGGDTVNFEPGHHGYKLNGARRVMRSSSEMRKGHLYVPVRLFNDLTAGKVHAEIHS